MLSQKLCSQIIGAYRFTLEARVAVPTKLAMRTRTFRFIIRLVESSSDPRLQRFCTVRTPCPKTHPVLLNSTQHLSFNSNQKFIPVFLAQTTQTAEKLNKKRERVVKYRKQEIQGVKLNNDIIIVLCCWFQSWSMMMMSSSLWLVNRKYNKIYTNLSGCMCDVCVYCMRRTNDYKICNFKRVVIGLKRILLGWSVCFIDVVTCFSPFFQKFPLLGEIKLFK